MPPLSQLMQMGPGNVFGGLGKGLGAGVGAGITKQIRRPLFNRLVDKFRTGNEDKARLNTLAQMGVTAAPLAGSEQYPIFQQMMEANQGMLNQRADRAQELWETDPQAAQEYLLAEQGVKFGKGAGASPKLSKGEMLATPEVQAAKAAMLDANERGLQAEFALADTPSPENWEALQTAHDDLDRAAADFTIATAGTGVKAADALPSLSQRMTRMKSLLDLKNTGANIRGKDLDFGAKLLEPLEKGQAKLNARSSAVTKTLGEYKKLAEQLKKLISQFNANPNSKENGQLYAQAAKTLGLAIEPGLQVTSSEVDLYSGENWAVKLLEFIPTVVRAAVGMSTADQDALEKAAADAANQNPYVLQRMLQQAATAIEAGMKSYQESAGSLQQGISDSALSMVELRGEFAGEAVDPAMMDQVRAKAAGIVGSTGVPAELQSYAPAFEAVASPTAPAPGDGDQAKAGEPVAPIEEDSGSLKKVISGEIKKGVAEATSNKSVIKGMSSGGKALTREELRAKIKANREKTQGG